MNTTPRVAVTGGIWRANRDATGRPMRNDSRHGITTTMVFAEHLTQEAPNGRDRGEHSVSKPNAMFVENVEDVGFGQNVRKRKSLVAREAGADGIQAGHGIAFELTAIPTAGLQ